MINMKENGSAVYKLVFMGDSNVGKTAIATRIASNTFSPCSEATIGASFFSKIIEKNKKNHKFNIWDTAGQEKYKCLVPLYYRNSNAAFVVYDITNNQSYCSAKKNVDELKSKSKVAKIVLIGNKKDMCDQRMVLTHDARKYAEEEDLIFIETSAKLNVNIDNILHKLLEHLPENDTQEKPSLPIINYDQRSVQCCNY